MLPRFSMSIGIILVSSSLTCHMGVASDLSRRHTSQELPYFLALTSLPTPFPEGPQAISVEVFSSY